MATKDAKPIVAGTDTPPDELPDELKGTIFDSSHVERGAHLNDASDTSLTGQMARIKEGNMATKEKAAAKGAAKTNGKAPAKNKVAAAPSTPFNRVEASAEWAKTSPCEAATGPKRDPRPCKGVGVVARESTGGKTIKVCAAHVLATEVSTVAERQAANAAKEAAKADKAPATKAAAAPKAAAKGKVATKAAQPAKATPAPKPSKKAAAKS